VTWLDRRGKPVTRAGEIVNYDAKELQLRLPQGGTQQVPTQRLVKIESERSRQHQRADEAFGQRDYSSALALYRSAYRTETRLWRKQQIVARCVECLHRLGRIADAAATYLALWKQDTETPYYATIPLAWRAKPADRGWENEALEWTDAGQPAVARLIGASWLLTGQHRAAADRTLVELTEREAAHWIGRIAAAQRWRMRDVAASDADLQELLGWQTTITQLPDGLRAGPAFVVARALARHNRPDEAVLLYLQVALVEEPGSELAAESLWASGQLLERAGRRDEAKRVFRELIDAYPDHPLTQEAQRAARSSEAAPG
jgi:tetratricopeptide (TPR) repeat protein